MKNKAVSITITKREDDVAVPWEQEEPRKTGGLSFSGFLIFLSTAVVFFFFASPYVELFLVKKALTAGDFERLEKGFDFDSLRDQVLGEAVREGGKGGDPLDGINATKNFLDTHFTPQGFFDLQQTSPKDRPSIPGVRRTFGNFPESKIAKMGYSNLDMFVAEMDDGVILHLERAGGFRWRVVQVDFPESSK
jgi:hypothetical protein